MRRYICVGMEKNCLGEVRCGRNGKFRMFPTDWMKINNLKIFLKCPEIPMEIKSFLLGQPNHNFQWYTTV